MAPTRATNTKQGSSPAGDIAKSARRSVGKAKAAIRAKTKRTKKPPPRRKRDGCTISISISERVDGTALKVNAAGEYLSAVPGGKGGVKGKAPGMPTANDCVALATLGHVQRLRIMVKLLGGPATYQSLQRTTKLKTGPLYHHINQLRLAGLLLPKQRDLYELTRGGRNLVLIGSLAAKLARDHSRRPISKG